MIERRNQKLALEKDKYLSQLPNVSEYKERFQAYSANSYIQAKTTGVPKDISTSLYVLNNTLNNFFLVWFYCFKRKKIIFNTYFWKTHKGYHYVYYFLMDSV